MTRERASVTIQAASENRRRDIVAAIGNAAEIEVLLLAAAPRADAVLLAVDADPQADIAQASRLLAEGRARNVILVGPTPSPELLLSAMRAGIVEYLPEPFQPADLLAALGRIRERGGPAAQPTRKGMDGRILLVLGAKGGIGTTTVAVNLADVLCRLGIGATALLDLAQPQGETPIFLDLEHAYTWADVAANISRLDATFLESVMARHPSGLSVLAAPGFSLDSSLDPSVLRQLLALMRGMYAHIVIDAGTGHDDAALEALEQADEVLLVLDLSLPCLARAKRFLEAVRAARPEVAAKVRLVANRKTSESDIGTSEAENILQTSISWSVLNDYKTALAAINQGKSLTETDPRSAIARGIAAMARDLARYVPAQVDLAGTDSGRPESLWTRLRSMPLGRTLTRRQG